MQKIPTALPRPKLDRTAAGAPIITIAIACCACAIVLVLAIAMGAGG